jgi:hypothetical protein
VPKRSIATVCALLLASVSAAEVVTSYPSRDSFARQYRMERSPRIEIEAGISGPVTISSVPSRVVDVVVQRSAATRRELDCHRVEIDHRPDRLTIAHVQFTDRPECQNIRASQSLTLHVPSDALVQVSGIAGELQVTGPLNEVIASSIAGHVSISAAGTADLESLADGLSLSIGSVSPGSATIESIEGVVTLDVGKRQDVEIRISALQGEVRELPPDFARLRTDDGYLLRSGEGGAQLSIDAVNGDVVVRRR